MPDETKKQKGKNEPKDQRRRRQGRQPAGTAAPVEKKPEKQPEVPKEPEKPACEPPGPEFYKNLKRETDEILKITEEANMKYKKKEIQSNWAKYEMPVVTYDEIDEQENLGADFEKLIQGPLSSGGHFQFRHEKSWDTDSGPSLYDKYFDINMNLLALAVSTIPFYERNGIDECIFNENDISAMNHRAMKFKQKYYNDNKYNTPEVEVQEIIVKHLTSHNDEPEVNKDDNNSKELCNVDDNILGDMCLDINTNMADTNVIERVLESKKPVPTSTSPIKIVTEIKHEKEISFKPSETLDKIDSNKQSEDEEIMIGNVEDNKNITMDNKNMPMKNETEIIFPKVVPSKDTQIIKCNPIVPKEVAKPKNPVIESPEDLEKWLDDFLDG